MGPTTRHFALCCRLHKQSLDVHKIIRMKKILVFVYLFFYFSPIYSQAEEKSILFSIDAGESKDDISIYRLGLQKEFTGWLRNKGIPLSGYFESSINYWKGSRSEIYGIAISPVFVVPLCDSCRYIPYVEAGVGVSFISNIVIEDRNLSSLFQFESRIGLGIKIGNIDCHIRYMHYSNASTVPPNAGIDILLAGVAFKF